MGSVEGVLMVLLLLGSAALVVYQSTTSPSCCLPVIARLKRNTIISKDFIDYVIRRGLPTVIVPAGEEEDPIFEFLPPSFNLHFLKTNVGSHRIPVKYSNNRGFLYYNVEQPLSNPASEACGLNIPIPDYNEAKATFKTIFNDSKWVGDGGFAEYAAFQIIFTRFNSLVPILLHFTLAFPFLTIFIPPPCSLCSLLSSSILWGSQKCHVAD
eukprot:m.48947 g.48947  ORF g.48947 m.48947 type:complete len:211 (+) comp7425_c0_seq3:163-795(+)